MNYKILELIYVVIFINIQIDKIFTLKHLNKRFVKIVHKNATKNKGIVVFSYFVLNDFICFVRLS